MDPIITGITIQELVARMFSLCREGVSPSLSCETATTTTYILDESKKESPHSLSSSGMACVGVFSALCFLTCCGSEGNISWRHSQPSHTAQRTWISSLFRNYVTFGIASEVSAA